MPKSSSQITIQKGKTFLVLGPDNAPVKLSCKATADTIADTRLPSGAQTDIEIRLKGQYATMSIPAKLHGWEDVQTFSIEVPLLKPFVERHSGNTLGMIVHECQILWTDEEEAS